MGYRRCEFEKLDYSGLELSKKELCSNIDSRTRKKENMGFHYSKIRVKDSEYYKKFEKIYQLKCGYCGISTGINPTSLFEIDHFINEKQERTPNGQTVNHIENLVFSCKKCNQAKDDFHVNGAYKTLHPDFNILQKVFQRNARYEIEIDDEFKNDEIIVAFYKQMGFSNKFRKLDFLLLKLSYLKEKEMDERLRSAFLEVYIKLLESRNRYF